ncbi:unnamed protein product, partial [Ixodes persulcatus]
LLAKASRPNWDTCVRRGQEATNACRVHGTARRCAGQGVPRANTRPGEGNGAPDTVTQRRGSPAGPLGGRRRKAGRGGAGCRASSKTRRGSPVSRCRPLPKAGFSRPPAGRSRFWPSRRQTKSLVVADTTACRCFCVNRSSPLF